MGATSKIIDENRVLLIHHRLLPGGHLEPEDGDLQEAALRELSEETEVSLRTEEVGGHAWHLPVDLPSDRLTAKVALHLASS